MNKCMYCGNPAPKMSLVCNACANALVELPKEKEYKWCRLFDCCGCGCKE